MGAFSGAPAVNFYEILFILALTVELRHLMTALNVYIANLRDKLENDSAYPGRIITEPGAGYLLITDS